MKKLIIVCMLLTLLGSAFGLRRALVMGNSSYDKVTLESPSTDVDSVAAYLNQMGFMVWKFKDLSLADFRAVVDSFSVRIGSGDEAVVYYSGHGTNQNGVNYLVPAGANLSTPQSYAKTAYSLSTLANKIKQAKSSVIILEACRNWGDPGSKTSSKSFVLMNAAAPSQVIITSAAPGFTVRNPNAVPSQFTQTFLRHISSSEEGLNAILPRIRTEVSNLTGSLQQPWASNALNPDFFFISKEQKRIWQNLLPSAPEGGGSLNW